MNRPKQSTVDVESNQLHLRIQSSEHRKSVLTNQFVPPNLMPLFAFTGINFRGMLHHVCDVAYDESIRGPIRTRECTSTN